MSTVSSILRWIRGVLPTQKGDLTVDPSDGLARIYRAGAARVLEDQGNKGQANGYAELDGSGKVPSSQLPAGGGGLPAPASGTGLVVYDGAATLTRSLAGTSGRIVITDPDGVSDAPTIDIGTDVVVTTDARLPTSDQKAAMAGSYGTPSAANKYVTASDPALTGTGGATGGAGAVAAYGQGRDGDVNFDGVNPVTDWSRSGSTYTYTGLRDPQYRVVTVATGVTLKTQGFFFFCRRYESGDNVIFELSGTAASGLTAGLGAMPAAIATSIAGATAYGGEDGANGRNSNASGLSAPSISAAALRGGGAGGSSGRVRLSSGSAIGTAGSGGGGTSTRNKMFYYGDPFKFLISGMPFYRNGTAIAQVAGGTGGGGGPLSTSGTSGGGGGGGGVVSFAAAEATFGTGCEFRLDGGGGGDAAAGANSVAAGGGGGGGGLGCCVIGSITGSNVPTFYGRGGEGGDGSLAGTGLWAEGGNGGEGGEWYVYFGTAPSAPTIVVTGGAGGASAGSGTGFVGSSAGADGIAYYGDGTT